MMHNRLRSGIQRFRRLLTRTETALAGLSLLALIALTLGQIVARNLFATGLPVADTLARHLVLYITFFGAALAADSQRHIRIDSLATWLPEHWLERLHRPLNGIAALVCAALTQAAARFWLDEWRYAADAERWQAALNLIIPVGFGLLALHFLLAVLAGPTRHNAR
ncbi:MAG: TRAP transporter small permease [Gammaproteobacteria bacterium]|nr:TRAP transporter small permease [Gammaproteobacteria bacterium]